MQQYGSEYHYFKGYSGDRMHWSCLVLFCACGNYLGAWLLLIRPKPCGPNIVSPTVDVQQLPLPVIRALSPALHDYSIRWWCLPVCEQVHPVRIIRIASRQSAQALLLTRRWPGARVEGDDFAYFRFRIMPRLDCNFGCAWCGSCTTYESVWLFALPQFGLPFALRTPKHSRLVLILFKQSCSVLLERFEEMIYFTVERVWFLNKLSNWF